jgi:VanZ family protein
LKYKQFNDKLEYGSEHMEKQIKFKNNLVIKRIIFLILLIVTFYIIFKFSQQDGITSGTISKKVTNFIINIFDKIADVTYAERLRYIELLHPIVRKLAHFSIYSVVGFSTMGFLCTFNIKNIFKVLISLWLGIIYALLDEIHQGFIVR